uniref:Galectin n=1 Tax=Leptobrachium leishanense TaxID=445787 RepID=A0A8C5R2M3_9ANUR
MVLPEGKVCHRSFNVRGRCDTISKIFSFFYVALCSFLSFCSFEINFLSESGDQIAFHFNPRFSEGNIICNSFLGSRWGQEERADTFPMEAKEPFLVEIYSDQEHFQVFVDDNKIMQYRHRVKQFSGITKVQILNDINISSVEITRRELY